MATINSQNLQDVAEGFWVCVPQVLPTDNNINVVMPLVYIYPDVYGYEGRAYDKIGEFIYAHYILGQKKLDSKFILQEVSDFTGQINNYYAMFQLA